MADFKVPVLPAQSAKVEPAATDKLTNDHIETETIKLQAAKGVGCPYKVPKWSAPPATEENYKFEVLKSGQIIEEVKQLQQQATWSFGRLPDNDIEMAHPTISRYHAVLQFKPIATNDALDDEDADAAETKSEQPAGWYIYDLGSTHGTFLNKQRIPTRVFIRVRVGHMLKLGASSRAYILQGPAEDEEPESELTVTQIREQRQQQIAAAAAEKQRKTLEAEERERNEGASWGMGEDADEETDLSHNPYASTNNEDLFFDDPKKTLRGFFEREGLHLEYKCDELSSASFVCRVELPVDDTNGRPIVVEVAHKGKKKDCVLQCALEACRTLDRHGVLRQANQESMKRKLVKAGDSDDDDEFWDRTGDVERKKQRKANVGASVTLTYENLLEQEKTLNLELQQIELAISNYQQNERRLKELAAKQQSTGDDLDSFMNTLSEDKVDKTEIKKLRLEQQRIKGEQQKLERLIKKAKPTDLRFGIADMMATTTKQSENAGAKKQMPMIGKRNQFSKFKVVRALHSTKPKTETKAFGSDEEEVEEEETETKSEVKKTANLKATETETMQPSSVESTEAVKVSISETVALEPIEQPTEKQIVPTSGQALAKETETEKSEEPTEEETAAQKKRRQRARQRNKYRPDVDIDELAEHEDEEKYAKWVPPTNQSGDGITHLNQKFGY